MKLQVITVTGTEYLFYGAPLAYPGGYLMPEGSTVTRIPSRPDARMRKDEEPLYLLASTTVAPGQDVIMTLAPLAEEAPDGYVPVSTVRRTTPVAAINVLS